MAILLSSLTKSHKPFLKIVPVERNIYPRIRAHFRILGTILNRPTDGFPDLIAECLAESSPEARVLTAVVRPVGIFMVVDNTKLALAEEPVLFPRCQLHYRIHAGKSQNTCLDTPWRHTPRWSYIRRFYTHGPAPFDRSSELVGSDTIQALFLLS